MKDIAVMYHYVREKNGWTGIHPLSPKNFQKQIEILAKYYDIVLPEDLDKKGTKPKCVLTFDDATKDQYSVAFEFLSKMGIPGYFTIMSGPLMNKEIPVFHLVHTVLSMFSDEEIWKELNNEFDLKNVQNKSNYYSYEKDLIRRYNKYALNFLLSEEQSRKFLEEKVILKYGSKEKFIEEFYISKEELKEIKNAGMTLGVHCVNHRPYCGNALDFYKTEIEPCSRFMIEELDIIPKWYTPAFGGGEKYKEMIMDLEPILEKEGYRGGFTTVEGLNSGLSKFWMNRYDCIKIPPVSNINLNELV